MSLILRQNTAKIISFGPFLDKTDNVTLETALAGTGANQLDNATTGVMLSKNGGALTFYSSTIDCTYDAFGNYFLNLSATDTNTVGTLRAQYSDATTCLPVWQDFIVMEEAIYDALFAVSATGALSGIWDEILTGATHNVPTSAGRRLRNLGAFSLVEGTLVAGGVAGTSTCRLDAAALDIARLYEQNLICITAGPGVGQSRMIVQYDTVPAARTVTIDRPWDVTTTSASEYSILSFAGLIIAHNGVAQSADTNHITFALSALDIVNSYVGSIIYILVRVKVWDRQD